MSGILETIQEDVDKASRIVSTFAPMTAQVTGMIQASLLAALAIKRLVQGTATNPDGSPITDAQFAAHFAAADAATEQVIETAAQAIAEDEARLSELNSQADGHH